MEVETYFLLNGRQTILKDPQATLDYSVDLTDWLTLVSDTIATVTWTQSSNLTRTTQSNTTTRAVAWFSGGIVGATEWANCHIVTTAGRIEERTIYFQIRQR